MKKRSKRFLSLVLALMICMGTLIMAANAEEDAQPEFPLADVAVPVTVAWRKSYDVVRITHVVNQETVMYEGEPMELYSIYLGARVWKTKTDRYSPSSMKVYKATLENGTLTAGELDFELEIPLNLFGHLYWNEGSVGNYYVVEISESYLNKKIGIHVVEGNLPENAPTHYVYDVALTQKPTYIEGDTCTVTVPAGTVVTLPYDTSDSDESIRFFGSAHVWAESEPSYVETYMCNGRKSFTVEPGRIYHVSYAVDIFSVDEGQPYVGISGNGAHIYIMAEDSTPTTYTAIAATQTVNVDGKDVTFYTYALVNENGGLTNYAKLRDVAAVLNGTKAQFAVGWNGAINLETGKPYTMAGGELEQTFVGDQPCVAGNTMVNVNGSPADLQAITLVDEKGGNYNYFKLRDLGEALGFNVGWSKDKGVFIETDKPYDPNN